MARRQRRDDAPTVGPEVAFPGSIRSTVEGEPLRVVVTVSPLNIAMHTDKSEIGSWPPAEVGIVRIDGTAFEFMAEGDRLIFVPDDPVAFTGCLFADERIAVTDPPRRLGMQRKPSNASTGAARPTRSRSRASRKAAAEPTSTAMEPRKGGGTQRLPSRPERAIASTDEKRDGTWLRMLDTARKRGMFSLDRIPVHENLRRGEHQHTWDHGAVATSGPSRYICTICGKVRLRGAT